MLQESALKFSWFWRRFLGVLFLPYMGMAAVLLVMRNRLKQIDKTPSTEGPMWNLVKTGQDFQKRKCFKITRFYTCI